MKILNIITGLIYIIGDAFLELIAKNCWVIGTLWYLIVFLAVGYFSIIGGLVIAFISIFFYLSFRENYLNELEETYESGWEISVIGIFLAFSLIVINAITTPYTYTKLGDFNLTKKELFYTVYKTDENGTKTSKELSSINTKLVVNNSMIKVSIKGCKEGMTTIYKETQENKYVPWLTFLDVDYRAECSNKMTHYKRVVK
jgi:heme/copper-type cytochrome/quinol oxidase subunit 2